MKDEHTYCEKMARNGRNTVIYKGTFVSNQSLYVYYMLILGDYSYVYLFFLILGEVHTVKTFNDKHNANNNNKLASQPQSNVILASLQPTRGKPENSVSISQPKVGETK